MRWNKQLDRSMFFLDRLMHWQSSDYTEARNVSFRGQEEEAVIFVKLTTGRNSVRGEIGM